VPVTYDPRKRTATLAERGLDFKDAEIVFAGPTFEVEDERRNYGENRIICFGSSTVAWSSLPTRRVARIVTSSV
jgi:uncharacterized DUF497 family protein